MGRLGEDGGALLYPSLEEQEVWSAAPDFGEDGNLRNVQSAKVGRVLPPPLSNHPEQARPFHGCWPLTGCERGGAMRVFGGGRGGVSTQA